MSGEKAKIEHEIPGAWAPPFEAGYAWAAQEVFFE
jgi:hypothetical protein